MNVPSLPTDNLYKFLAVFGIILLIYSSYMLSESPLTIYDTLDDLKAKESINKLQHNQDSVSAKINQIQLENQLIHLKRKADKLVSLMTLYMILFFTGAL